MNLKIAVLSNWKTLVLLAQLSLLAASIIAVTPLGDPIDNPIAPG